MKCKLRLFTLFLLFIHVQSVSFAQETTTSDKPATKVLFSNLKLKSYGFYVAPEVQYSQYAKDFTFMNGGSLMFLFNEKWAFGANFMSNWNKQFTPTDIDATQQTVLSVSNIGLRGEYTLQPHRLIHFSFPLTIGRGAASVRDIAEIGDRGPRGAGFFGSRNASVNYYIQPGVQAEINVLKFAKVFAGANYRIATYVNNNNANYALTSSQLNGFNINAGIKLGFFNKMVKG